MAAITPSLPISLREGGAAGIEGVAPLRGLDAPEPVASTGFADVLGGMLESAATAKVESTQQAEALARGASDDLHGTMIAIKEAEISVKLVGSIRNKLLDAFQELWRTNV
ncbi:MAG: flagellar hook-basal body complex protein FliE [Myxococcales bacterium]|nr:flagellar hook-basal body complex protein FliE [Myxococcales bacterium]